MSGNEVTDGDPLGLGPLQSLLEEETVDAIIVSRFDRIAVERDGVVVETPHRFTSEGELRSLMERIAVGSGHPLDEGAPALEARLGDAGRASGVIPPLSADGSALVIRATPRSAWTADDLVESGTLSREACTILDAAMRGGLNVVVSGAPGSGKTTLINALSAFIPMERRIITIEDVAEFRLRHPNVIRLETGTAVSGRAPGFTKRDLASRALRLHPDYFVFGDIRGEDSIDVLLTMRSGAGGVLAPIHADSPRTALDRLETLAILGSAGLSSELVRRHIAAVDLVVQLERTANGGRRVTSVSNVVVSDQHQLELHDLLNDDLEPDSEILTTTKGGNAPGPHDGLLKRLARAGIELPWSVVPPRPHKPRRT